MPISLGMKSFVFVTLLIFFSLKVEAFEYKIEESSLLRPSTLQGYELTKMFNEKGFYSLSDTSLVSAGLPFDKVFVSENWEKVLLLKAGLKAPGDIEGKLLEDPALGVSVIHFQFEGTPYLLLSMNNSTKELRDIIRPWLKSETSAKWAMFFPNAQAQEPCVQKPGFASQLEATSSYIENNEILKSIGRCATDALHGAKESVGDTLSFFKKLATNPSQLWSEMKESFVQLKNFAMNIQSELASAIGTLRSLSTEEKTQIACTMAGQTMVSAVQGMIGGAGLAKLLPMLILKVKQTAAMLKEIANLEKLGIKFSNKSGLMKEVMSCAY